MTPPSLAIRAEGTALYRLYDAKGRLLYVGITDDLPTRFTAHKRDKAWWPAVPRREVAWLVNRAEAPAAEES